MTKWDIQDMPQHHTRTCTHQAMPHPTQLQLCVSISEAPSSLLLCCVFWIFHAGIGTLHVAGVAQVSSGKVG